MQFGSVGDLQAAPVHHEIDQWLSIEAAPLADRMEQHLLALDHVLEIADASIDFFERSGKSRR